MLPLSFKEFFSVHSQPINFKEVYNRYIHYPKYIITLDDDNEINYDGIRVINAIDFLLEK